MIDPERLAAFAVMTAVTSLVPGLSMLFVMGQTVQRGWRGGAAALGGMQLGYIGWWILAALGLGTLASAFPAAFNALAIAGAGYLAWLGLQAIRHAGHGGGQHATADAPRAPKASRPAFRGGVMVALGNPKSLVYIVALLPPFIDPHAALGPQLVIMCVVAMAIDVTIGGLYIAAGHRLARAMERPATRRRVDRALGAIYLVIAAGLLTNIALG